ncbi:MAG: thermonuclease family protein [Gammaproteobacteria bacterium]|nr:thermonuclease family protein [Gammaproteobacteria bacterium]
MKQALFTSAFLFWALLSAAAAEEAQVRHVLDGDTVILANGKHLRLIGMNAPELGKDGAPDQAYAMAARQRLSALVQGQRVSLKFEREHADHYGRLLAHIVLANGQDVEQILLNEGLAWTVAIPPNIDNLADYLTAENQAHSAQRGIWSEAAYAPKPVEQLTTLDTGFRLIEGKVLHQARRRNIIYLDLSARVSLVVASSDWKKYYRGKPADWVGRHVIARGWLTQYKQRLHMRVPHPAMLTSIN